jgi:hypothetical protein
MQKREREREREGYTNMNKIFAGRGLPGVVRGAWFAGSLGVGFVVLRWFD